MTAVYCGTPMTLVTLVTPVPVRSGVTGVTPVTEVTAVTEVTLRQQKHIEVFDDGLRSLLGATLAEDQDMQRALLEVKRIRRWNAGVYNSC